MSDQLIAGQSDQPVDAIAEKTNTDEAQLSVDKQTPNCILFYGVTYLGCATVNAPKSEPEINRIMATLNEQCKLSIQVTMSVPQHVDEKIILLDAQNDSVITEYKMAHVLFVVRGHKNSTENACFAFTTCQGDSMENFRFSCHVFRCKLADAVSKILYSFWAVFNRQQQMQLKFEGQQTTGQVNSNAAKRPNTEGSSTGQLSSVASSIFGSLNFSASSFSSIAGGIGSNNSNVNNNPPYSIMYSDFAVKFSRGRFISQIEILFKLSCH